MIDFEKDKVFINARKIIKKLRNRGYEAYIVGGFVRDYLLNNIPSDYEIDIVTSAKPNEIVALFDKALEVGAKFGVIIVYLDGIQYEVATFRKDARYIDGRHPEKIIFSNMKEDAKRRDFTINGLYMDPFIKNSQGKYKIFDYVGGIDDLNKRIIRAIGDPKKRFDEDYLRMLRAIRFYTKLSDLGFKLEKKTLQAIKEKSQYITQISAERIREELNKILVHKNRVKGLELLDKTKLLKVILPEVERMKGIPQPPEFHPEGDVWIHTLKTLEHIGENPSVELAWAALLHDVGKPETITIEDRIRFNKHCQKGAEIAENILRRLKFSNEQIKKIVEMVKNHMNFINVPNMRIAKLKKFVARPTFKDELILHKADCLASHKDLSIYNFLTKKIEEFKQEDLKPEPIIKGRDLIAIGLKPGPIFKKILDEVYELQLENTFETKKEYLEYIKEKYLSNEKNN